MATPKRRTIDCPVRIACDGKPCRPEAESCSACRDAIKQKAAREKRAREAENGTIRPHR